MKRLTVLDKKTGQRNRMIVYNHCQWNKILERVRNTAETAKDMTSAAIEREQRKQMSKEMAATWDNTFINLRKKRFQMRRNRLEREKEKQLERYTVMKREQEELKKEIKKKAREIIFEQRDSTKVLRSAQKLCEIYKERDAQIAFKKMIKEREKEDNKQYAQQLKDEYEQFLQDEKQKMEKFFGDKEKNKKEAVSLMKQLEQKKHEGKNEKLAYEKDELRLMKEELDLIEENIKEEAARKKLVFIKYAQDGIRYYRENEAKKRADDRDEDKAIEIVYDGKVQVAEKRREREEEIQNAFKKRIEIACEKMKDLLAKKDNKDEENYQKAVAEKDAIFEKSEAGKREYAERLRQERIDYHKQILKEMCDRNAEEHEIFKWAVLQRLKNDEHTTRVNEEVSMKKLRRTLACQNSNRKIIKEHNQKIAKEKQEDVDALKRAMELWSMEDTEFLEFAEKIKDDCKAKGQTVYPIEKAIFDYKKRNGLIRNKRGVGLVEVAPIVPLDVTVEKTPPRRKFFNSMLDGMRRRAEVSYRPVADIKSIEQKLQECICVKTGNGLDTDDTKKKK